MTAGSARHANRRAIAASFAGQAIMLIAVASAAVTGHTSHAPHFPAPQPAPSAPMSPHVSTPSGITLLPYVEQLGPGNSP